MFIVFKMMDVMTLLNTFSKSAKLMGAVGASFSARPEIVYISKPLVQFGAIVHFYLYKLFSLGFFICKMSKK